MGIDPGQRRDHTALAVVERRDLPRAFQAPIFSGLLVRHAERVPLGTPYPSVVQRIREVTESDELPGRCTIAVDATGVGAPVVDSLRAARLDCEIAAVRITSGEREQQHGNSWNVPKRDLIAGVQVLLERGELKIARRMKEAGALTRELMNIRMVNGANGRVRLGAEGSGEHDDLAIALALACWRAKRGRARYGTQRLPGI